MINPTELRLGNLVNYHPNHKVDYCIVKALISPYELRLATLDGQLKNIVAYADSGYINPIPLTLGLLEQCGLAKGSRIEVWIEALGLTRSYFLDGTFNGGIQYLHQLQNLVFVLTGEELKVNLTKAIA